MQIKLDGVDNMQQKTKKDLPHNYALLVSVLREGKENCLTSKEIIRRLGWKDNEQRNVFHIVEQLVNKYGYLIGASRKGHKRGYYLIANDDEFFETAKTYNKQIQSMLNRLKNLQKNYAEQQQYEN